jgi:hypothetical protein
MKQVLLLTALLVTLPSCQVVSSFTKGFKEGYDKGAAEAQKKSGSEPAATQKTSSTEPAETSAKPTDAFRQAVLKRSADQLNKSVPMKVDEETTLTKVEVEKDGLLYNYELVNYTSAQLPSDAANQTFRPLVKERLCADEKTKADLKNGYSYYYSYFGNDKKLITKFAITPKDCGF